LSGNVCYLASDLKLLDDVSERLEQFKDDLSLFSVSLMSAGRSEELAHKPSSTTTSTQNVNNDCMLTDYNNLTKTYKHCILTIDWLIDWFYFILNTNTDKIQARESMWQKRKSQVEKPRLMWNLTPQLHLHKYRRDIFLI